MKAKRGVPYLSVVRTIDKKDTPFNAKTATRQVPDPWSSDGGKITVTASMRDDPLSRLHLHKQLAPHLYAVGLELQQEFERADYGKSAPDCRTLILVARGSATPSPPAVPATVV